MTNWAIDEAQEWERLAGIAAIDANFRTRIIRAMKAATFGNRAVVYVQQASDLAGTLDSSVVYWIDGVIDMAGQSIEVPAGGLNLRGWTFDVSKLISSEDNYTMFTSPVGGSGNILGADFAIEVTGANSQVYNIFGATGFEAAEYIRVNFNDCTWGGTIDNYRQGLETGTGRFGGSPTLTLKGAWVGGYRITTSIVRSLDAGMTTPLFQAGAGFVMQSRFLTDINADLPTNAALLDFAPVNFPNPSTLIIRDAVITRNGVINPDDANITPNISNTDLASNWKNNHGVANTYVGGRQTITSEAATTINFIGTFEDMAGTFTPSLLTHFDAPANGQLRHLGDNPRDYELIADFTIDGTPNDEVAIKIVKWDDSAAGFVDVATFTRQINALTGGRDVAFFNLFAVFALDENDYIKMQVANNTSTDSLTAEDDGFFIIDER